MCAYIWESDSKRSCLSLVTRHSTLRASHMVIARHCRGLCVRSLVLADGRLAAAGPVKKRMYRPLPSCTHEDVCICDENPSLDSDSMFIRVPDSPFAGDPISTTLLDRVGGGVPSPAVRLMRER